MVTDIQILGSGYWEKLCVVRLLEDLGCKAVRGKGEVRNGIPSATTPKDNPLASLRCSILGSLQNLMADLISKSDTIRKVILAVTTKDFQV